MHAEGDGKSLRWSGWRKMVENSLELGFRFNLQDKLQDDNQNDSENNILRSLQA